MISGHGTEKLFSMGIEILGLQYIERGLLRMLFQSTRALNIFGSSLSRRVTMGWGIKVRTSNCYRNGTRTEIIIKLRVKSTYITPAKSTTK